MLRPLVALLLLTATADVCHAARPDSPVSFRKDVAPILVAKCLGCHGEKKSSGGLRMSTFTALRRGGKSAGEMILEPGDPDASGLIESVKPGASPRMPYKQPPLGDEEVRTLEEWVRQGARFDGPSESETPLASLVDPLTSLPAVALKVAVTEPITSLTYATDGATLAVATGRSVVLVDAATGKARKTLDGHPGPVTSVSFTPDGKTLVAAGGRAGMFGAVTAWDATRRVRAAESRGHADAILTAAVSPDGKTLATGSYDRTVVIWELASLKPLRTLRDHTDAVFGVSFTRDGSVLASAAADRTVKLWDPATGRRLKTLSDATAELSSVAFSPDGATVLAGGVDRSLRAWKVGGTETKLTGSVFAHEAPITRLLAAPDGRTLISAGEDRTVKLWDLVTLAPRVNLGGQPDWPQAIAVSPDGRRLAVGRLDGSVAVYELSSGKTLLTFSPVPPVPPPAPPKPELVRNATLNPPSPRGVPRGKTTRMTLSGLGVGRAEQILLTDRGTSAAIISPTKPDPNRLEIDLTVAADARVGLHSLSVLGPLGVPASRPFEVESHPAVEETEPNDAPTSGGLSALPATFVGTIAQPGDVDHFRFHARRGAELTFAVTAKALGSALHGTLALVDERGGTVVEASNTDGASDPVLALTVPETGDYALRVTDMDYEGSGNHFYRISSGADPVVNGVFPLGVTPGRATECRVDGQGLGVIARVPFAAPEGAQPGTIVAVPLGLPADRIAVGQAKVVVAEGAQAVESEPNDDPDSAAPLPLPGGVSGRIGRDGDLDLFRFEARRGERVIIETFGRRLGTKVDPLLEILDRQGHPVPRAVLRPVAETEVAFRDHNATGPGIRLTRWNNLAVNDTVLFGREVARIFALPRNPDDDCQLWSEQGMRLGFLETTPEHHPMGQPIYKVEVHPAGSAFAAGGQPPVVLDYRNDDGGPGFGQDARVTFDPPADATYLVSVGDARGVGGERFGYHLVLRRPRPDFTLSASTADPNVPRGSTALLTVSVSRHDGFDAPVMVTAGHLPEGVTATPALIERGATTAALALSADATAPAFSPPAWTLSAAALDPVGGTASASGPRHELDPGGPNGGRITVTPEPNLRVAADPWTVSVRPGGVATLKLSVERGPAFSGRVPVDVRNLPHGVRVLDVGLNGVLVTEAQAERTIRIFAEPWAATGTRPFYAVGKAESAGTEHSSPPITLVVTPVSPAPDSPQAASAGSR